MDEDRLDGFWPETEADPPAAEAPTPEPVAAVESPEPAPTPEPEEDEPSAVETTAGKMVPVHALTAARKDYKGQLAAKAEEAARLDERLKAAEKQLEDLKRAPTPSQPATPQPAPQAELPDPVTNPREYAAAIRAEAAQTAFNDRLNLSEWTYKQSNPQADTTALATRFQSEVTKNPALAQQMRSHPHPYQFAADTLARLDTMAEIGDPIAWRETQIAAIRAQIEAERAGQPVPAQPVAPKAVPVLPVSLANARNAPPRTGAPDADEDLLSAVVRKR